MNIQDKLVIVTGGSRGIGLAIVQSLLAVGYRVATCSRRPSEAINQLQCQYNETFTWIECRIGEEASETSFMKEVFDWAGSAYFWALVNNAGVAGEGILATYPNVESERILQVNLLGALRLCRLALRKMLGQHRGGRIVNISSMIGSRGYTGLAAYAASKAGMDGMTRSLAREFGRKHITVNSVAPGYVETELSRSLSSEQLDQIVRRTPLGSLATTEDIAGVVVFLLSREARFITGQTITVDGGISC